jgi:O-antigen ligase
LLALMAALVMLFRARFGWLPAMLMGMLAIPGLLLLGSERQTSIAGAGTAHSRVWLWSDALMELRYQPLFGTGHNALEKVIDLVAHNSYLHAYAELGLLGGALFLGAFAFALFSLYQFNADRRHVDDPVLRRLQPYLLAALVGYMAGMCTLSLCYVVPTYTMLGMACAFIYMTPARPAWPQPRFNFTFLRRIAGLSIAFLGVMYIFVRVFK